jgi:hypothetical protein
LSTSTPHAERNRIDESLPEGSNLIQCRNCLDLVSELLFSTVETIKADIFAHLDDGNLSVAMVAGRPRVTPRFLQRLFQTEDTNFSEFVVGQRLAEALTSSHQHPRLRRWVQ